MIAVPHITSTGVRYLDAHLYQFYYTRHYHPRILYPGVHHSRMSTVKVLDTGVFLKVILDAPHGEIIDDLIQREITSMSRINRLVAHE